MIQSQTYFFLVQSFSLHIRNYHHCNKLVARSENWIEQRNQSHRIFVALVPLQPPSSQSFRSPSPIIGLKLVPFLLVASILSKVIASAQLLACLVDRNKQTNNKKPPANFLDIMYKRMNSAKTTSKFHYCQKEIPYFHPKARFCSRPRLVRWQHLHGTHYCLVFSVLYPHCLLLITPPPYLILLTLPIASSLPYPLFRRGS